MHFHLLGDVAHKMIAISDRFRGNMQSRNPQYATHTYIYVCACVCICIMHIFGGATHEWSHCVLLGNYLFAALLAGTGMRASKLMSYGIIISALLTQLAYAKVLVGEEEEDKDKENKSLEPPVQSQDSQDVSDSQWVYFLTFPSI